MPVLIYLAFNAGRDGAHGWGAAMSTDTAFALGAVALVTPRTATRIRVFLLTLAVVDDLAALVVIATVYAGHVSFVALGVAIVLFAGIDRAALRAVRPQRDLYRLGGRDLGRDVQVGHRSGDLRAGDRARDERVPADPRGSRAGDGADAVVPGAADARARALGAAEPAVGDLGKRAAPVRPSPVDELCDRSALRARQRRDPSDGQAHERRHRPHRSRWGSSSPIWSASRSASSPVPGSRRAPPSTVPAP